MQRIVAFLLVAVLLNCGATAWAQTQKDVLKALIVMESKCQAGISRRDYPTALADVVAEVRMFSGTEEAKKTPKFLEAASKAAEHYMFFGEMMRATDRDGYFFLRHQPAAYKAIVARYPTLEQPPGPAGPVVRLRDLASQAFTAAAQATQEAQQSLGR